MSVQTTIDGGRGEVGKNVMRIDKKKKVSAAQKKAGAWYAK